MTDTDVTNYLTLNPDHSTGILDLPGCELVIEYKRKDESQVKPDESPVDPDLGKRGKTSRGKPSTRDERLEGSKECKTFPSGPSMPKSLKEPIRILHLSDLHMKANSSWETMLYQLGMDLKSERFGIDRLDYLVVSGDLTHKAQPDEFKKARQFLDGLMGQFGVKPDRCIVVPGNHDVNWKVKVYTWKSKNEFDVTLYEEGHYKPEGDGYLVRKGNYPQRFSNFAKHFFEPLLQREYPLPPNAQSTSHFFPDHGILFLEMNSCWEIDERFRERASVFHSALVHGLEEAKQKVGSARQTQPHLDDMRLLKIAVLHHPVTGNEKIKHDSFLMWLEKEGFQFCLHGHSHKAGMAVKSHEHPNRRLRIVGAGSLGAEAPQRPESIPRLYNLLEVQSNRNSVQVCTRCLREQYGTWESWPKAEGESPGQTLDYVEIPLPLSKSLDSQWEIVRERRRSRREP